MENGIFHCLVQERKQERQKIGRKIIPLDPQRCPTFFLLFFFNFFFSFFRQSLFVFSLGINIAFFFFFLLIFLGVGRDSLFLFLLDVIFFWNMFFIFIKNLGDCSFLCGYLSLSFNLFLIWHHSLTRIYE